MNRIDNIFDPAFLIGKLQSFLDQGGVMLVVIMFSTLFLWMLILERYYYFYFIHGNVINRTIKEWLDRRDKRSWYARKIRLQLISLVRAKTERYLAMIKLMVVIAPLMGLLGTVTGMISVFDVMASTGSSNARGMAAGVSQATIPTMAGMVVSLSGMLFSVALKRRSEQSIESLSNVLAMEEAK